MWLLEQVEISQKEGVCVKMGYYTKTREDNFLGKTRELQNSVVHVYNKIQPISTTGLEDNPLK